MKSYIAYTLLVVITLGGLYYYISQPKVMVIKNRSISHIEKETIQSTFGYNESVAGMQADEKEIEKSDYFPVDDFGNYILSEDDLESMDKIPVNENGKVLYNVYADGEGNILNPMPDYYAYYEEYFEIGHSVLD